MIELKPAQIDVTPEEAKILRTFAHVTNGYRIKTFNLQDIFCEGEEIEGAQALNGQTSFFRHSFVTRYLLEILEREGKKENPIKVLAAPSSIGCEANGLTALALSKGFNNIAVHGFDRSQIFTDIARLGVYPNILARRLERSSHLLFEASDDAQRPIVPVKDEIRDRVTFLEPSRFQDFETDDQYDIVMVNNLFQYTTDDDTEAIIRRVKQLEPSFIIFTRQGAENLTESIREGYSSLEHHWYFQEEERRLGKSFEGEAILKSYEFWFRDTPPQPS